MILADVDSQTVVAASLVSAIAGGAATLLTRWLAYRKDERKQDDVRDAASDRRADKAYREIIASKDEYIAMQRTVIVEMERAQEAWQAAAADCREDVAEQRTINFYLFDALKRAFAELRALGREPGPLPELPPARPRRDAEAEFLSRNAAQSAKVVREIGDSHVSEPALKPPKGG